MLKGIKQLHLFLVFRFFLSSSDKTNKMYLSYLHPNNGTTTTATTMKKKKHKKKVNP